MFDFRKRISLPKDFIEEARKDNEHTPDMAEMAVTAARWVLITHDQMKRMIPERPTSLYVGFTVPRFTVLKENRLQERSYPIPLEEHFSAYPKAPMRGWLYLASPDFIFELDKLMENTVKFNRRRMNIHVPFWEQSVVHRRASLDLSSPFKESEKTVTRIARLGTVRAWVYVGNPTYWNEMFNGTDGRYFGYNRVRLFELKLPYLPETIPYPDRARYYCFTPMEYNDE